MRVCCRRCGSIFLVNAYPLPADTFCPYCTDHPGSGPKPKRPKRKPRKPKEKD